MTQDSTELIPSVNSSCIGCCLCEHVCSSVFELDSNGMSRVKKLQSYFELKKQINESIQSCPVQAISWVKQ